MVGAVLIITPKFNNVSLTPNTVNLYFTVLVINVMTNAKLMMLTVGCKVDAGWYIL